MGTKIETDKSGKRKFVLPSPRTPDRNSHALSDQRTGSVLIPAISMQLPKFWGCDYDSHSMTLGLALGYLSFSRFIQHRRDDG